MQVAWEAVRWLRICCLSMTVTTRLSPYPHAATYLVCPVLHVRLCIPRSGRSTTAWPYSFLTTPHLTLQTLQVARVSHLVRPCTPRCGRSTTAWSYSFLTTPHLP